MVDVKVSSGQVRGLVHFLNFLVGILTIASAIVSLDDLSNSSAPFDDKFRPGMVSFYLVLFGAFIIFLEVYSPDIVLIGFAFYRNWIGRGMFFIFLAMISYAQSDLAKATFFVNLITGSFYIVAQCLSCSGFGIQMPRGVLNDDGGSTAASGKGAADEERGPGSASSFGGAGKDEPSEFGAPGLARAKSSPVSAPAARGRAETEEGPAYGF